MAAAFVNFAVVKKLVSLDQVLARSGLLDGFSKKGEKLTGPCPFCKEGGKRAFQVNLAKNVWYCFGKCKRGGNVLDFVAEQEGVGVAGAARRLDTWFDLGLGCEEGGKTDARSLIPPLRSPPSPPQPPDPAPPAVPLPALNPPLTFTLKTLDPEHPSLAEVGLTREAIAAFGVGFCTKGLLRGRIAIPVRNPQGELVAYTGLAVGDEAPRYLFPEKFNPALEVWNLDRLPATHRQGPLFLCPEVLDALRFADGRSAILALFDGSLSERQEMLVAEAARPHDGLVLVGEGFPDRTVARLARHAPLTWFLRRPADERS